MNAYKCLYIRAQKQCKLSKHGLLKMLTSLRQCQREASMLQMEVRSLSEGYLGAGSRQATEKELHRDVLIWGKMGRCWHSLTEALLMRERREMG